LIYQVPDDYYIRLHHPRPRFKGNIEEVLIYMASEIVKIGKQETKDFIGALNKSIRAFPGNLSLKEKTINNWRTEIDALLGLIQYDDRYSWPTRLAKELADNQDLVKFFKIFSYKFQYPSGAMKPHEVKRLLENNVHFRPSVYILKMLKNAEDIEKSRVGITKAELTHCVFNDLRVVRDNRSEIHSWELIKENRIKGKKYDWKGDVIRYAGDILDYLEQANILIRHPDFKYYLNHNEDLAIERFINPDQDFYSYDYLSKPYELSSIRAIKNNWIEYMNEKISDGYFDTDIIALISNDSYEYKKIKEDLKTEPSFIMDDDINIGYAGENLTVNHEKLFLKKNNRSDLVHLVKLIPSNFAVGYDINSRDLDNTHKMIEVKSTASTSLNSFTRFHLTPNEWSAAETHEDNYYVYRLLINKSGIKLHVIQNPVQEYREKRIKIHIRDGVDIIFDPEISGEERPFLMEKEGEI